MVGIDYDLLKSSSSIIISESHIINTQSNKKTATVINKNYAPTGKTIRNCFLTEIVSIKYSY